MGEYKQPPVDTSIKLGSFAFFLSIPLTFALGFSFSETTYQVISQIGFEPQTLTLVLYAFVTSAVIFSLRWLQALRTLIHELKHAILVLVSGNKLTDIKVRARKGHVSYMMYADKTRFAPFILLAPYFFSMFSLPTFIAALFIGDIYPLPLSIALGLTVGIDLTCNYKEYHPQQSDLQRIAGGRIGVLMFILGTNFCWAAASTLWIVAGNAGFILTSQQILNFTTNLVSSWIS